MNGALGETTVEENVRMGVAQPTDMEPGNRAVQAGVAMTGAVPPHDGDAEQALIGSAILDHDVAEHVGVRAEDFWVPRHEVMWRTLIGLNGAHPDRARGLLDALRAAGEFKTGLLDGPYIATCVRACTTPAAAAQYAAAVQQTARLRRAQQAVQRAMQRLGAVEPEDLDGVLYEAMGDLETVASDGAPGGAIPRRSWQPVDLGPVLDGAHTPPAPTVGVRDDGVGMFYPGRQHTAASESEAGKTWLALVAAVVELNRGNAVTFLDFEDDEGGIVGRLLALQVRPGVLRDRFAYLRPESPITDAASQSDLAHALGDLRPTLVILDGVTEGMVLHGLDPLSNRDAAQFGQMLPGWIAAQGPAVVSLDHVTKSADGRGRYALGAVHKLNGLNGAAYVLDSKRPIGIGLTGRSTVKIAKDRPGQLRRHGQPSSAGLHWFGDLVVDSQRETFLVATIETPTTRPDSWRPTHIMTTVAQTLADAGKPLSGQGVTDRVGGKATNARQALAFLVDDGYVQVADGPRGAKLHRLVKAYGDVIP